MAPENGNDRFDRIERALERVDSKFEERTTETATLLNRLTGVVVDLARVVEGLRHGMEDLQCSQKQLFTSQILMQERIDHFVKRIADLVSGIGAYLGNQEQRRTP